MYVLVYYDNYIREPMHDAYYTSMLFIIFYFGYKVNWCYMERASR
jgi:hypothetical protein